ncbi:shikimate kinase [Halococcus saccharolyticus]|uniref:Shikimate kinase n=1 Tax=Halococcus saccharolyticus DSM 5350 TaxID=1227455 RepID=M0MRY9_9EURY|nr:shikimate kinase [Halococcus saccharolyticus]EMA47230.1 shikimate kinase [Halococcus saccharolyticus DSM 5350]
MHGRASAPAAGTIVNALATGCGAAFAIDRETAATVELHDEGGVTGEIDGAPDADTRLIERCVELVIAEYGDGEGGHVHTESEVPMAAGLKSSSAAANATVLATLDALGVAIDDGEGHTPDGSTVAVSRERAARLGVRAAREAGVTVTGAFDDASASMLGGVTVTDNTSDELLARETIAWDVAVWTPDERAFSADADTARCERVAPVVRVATDLALAGEYERAMTVNGLAFCAALDFPTEPAITALGSVEGVSLSGTGPSYVAVGDRSGVEKVQEAWDEYEGHTWLTTTRTDGAWTG